jgi:hypothetical protein
VPPGTESEVQQLSLLSGPQPFWPGAPPTQLGAMHVPPEQTASPVHALPHAPQWALFVFLSVSQPFAALPSQLIWPSLQEPRPQTPPMHDAVAFAAVHAAPLCHAPLGSQVCGVTPSHCFASGVQTPVHCPPPHK